MTQAAESSVTGLSLGSWVFSPAHGESLRILDLETVWNHIGASQPASRSLSSKNEPVPWWSGSGPRATIPLCGSARI